MIKVKICGITCEKEIQYLNILKPDYCGFVFAKSKRKISIEKAAGLMKVLDKDIRPVGIFRNNDLEEIIEACKKVKFYAIQLHGNEDFKLIENLKMKLDSKIKIWKAFSINDESNIVEFMERKHPYIDKYLIDGSNPGSGEEYNLDKLKNIIEKYDLKRKFILAGGINEENAVKKIKEVCPEIIDVSSGVEITENNTTMKSFYKIEQLLKKVRFLND